MAIAIGGNSVNKAYLGTTEIQKMYLGSDLVFDNSAPPLSLTPIMTNFRVNEATPTHVHFDAPLGPVTGLTTQGFTVSGKAVTNINTLIGYIEVDTPFTFWDNNTIRLEGGNGVVYDFTMTYISNLIDEPDAVVNRYVSSSGSGDGTSEAAAASLTYALANANPGETWWIKAGTYPGQYSASRGGALDNPIKYKGYTSAIGDLDDDYIVDSFTYTSPAQAEAQIDPTKFPVISGDLGSTGDSGMFINNRGGLIFKNIQLEKNYYNVWCTGSANSIHLENCTYALGAVSPSNGGGLGFLAGNVLTTSNIRNYKCLGFDNGGVNFRAFGDTHAYIESKAYSGIDSDQSSDYYFSFYETQDCIVHKCHAERIGDIQHGGHGFGLKSSDTPTEAMYNLWSENKTVNIAEAYYIAHSSRYNVMKFNEVHVDPLLHDLVVGFVIRDGGRDNILENNYGEGIMRSFSFWDSNENDDGETTITAVDNVIRNNIFHNLKYIISNTMSTGSAQGNPIHGNRLYNNTFVNTDPAFISDSFVYINLSFPIAQTYDNLFQGNIIQGFNGLHTTAGAGTGATMDYDYNDFFNCGFTTPSGTGNIDIDPVFNNTNQGGFQPTATFDTIDTALISGINTDAYGDERGLNGNTAMGGVSHEGEGDGSVTPPVDFEIISYNLSQETSISIRVQTYITKQCSINYYVDGVKNAASSDDFNAGYIGPDEYRHTRTLTGIDLTVQRTLVIEVTAEDDLEVVQSGDIALPVV